MVLIAARKIDDHRSRKGNNSDKHKGLYIVSKIVLALANAGWIYYQVKTFHGENNICLVSTAFCIVFMSFTTLNRGDFSFLTA